MLRVYLRSQSSQHQEAEGSLVACHLAGCVRALKPRKRFPGAYSAGSSSQAPRSMSGTEKQIVRATELSTSPFDICLIKNGILNAFLKNSLLDSHLTVIYKENSISIPFHQATDNYY